MSAFADDQENEVYSLNSPSPIGRNQENEKSSSREYALDFLNTTTPGKSPVPLLSNTTSPISSPTVQEQESSTESNEETSAQKREREDRESQALAWEMMRQESLEIAEMQTQYMLQNATNMSAEDYNVMQMLLAESGIRVRASGAEEEEGESVSGEEDEVESNPDQWDYERLLELGETIGDVKTERWKIRAKSIIDNLPVVHYSELTQSIVSTAAEDGKDAFAVSESQSSSTSPVLHNSEETKKRKSPLSCITDTPIAALRGLEMPIYPPNPPLSIHKSGFCTEHSSPQSESDTEINVIQVNLAAATSEKTQQPSKKVCTRRALDPLCAVCMDVFVSADALHLLPCQHYFHTPCSTAWLMDHNSCPICKSAVAESP